MFPTRSPILNTIFIAVMLVSIGYSMLATIGLIVQYRNIRNRKRLENSLRIQINEYHETREALQAADEMLRAQVDEYITMQRQLEEQVRQQQRLESIGLLARGIAHDLSNLLTPIFVYSELIRKKFSDGDPVHRHAGSIMEASGKANNLVKQLLSFSRDQALSYQILNLNDIISEFSNILKRTIRENVDINHTLCISPCMIKADRTQVEQILLNLALNTQDFISGNGSITIETGHVTLDDEHCQLYRVTRSGHYIMMTFSDSGTGLDDTTLAQIFEPFFGVKAVGNGTGRGLSTAYDIVKQHNGAITVQSRQGSGTSIRIYLPAASTTAEQDTIQSSHKGAPQS